MEDINVAYRDTRDEDGEETEEDVELFDVATIPFGTLSTRTSRRGSDGIPTRLEPPPRSHKEEETTLDDNDVRREDKKRYENSNIIQSNEDVKERYEDVSRSMESKDERQNSSITTARRRLEVLKYVQEHHGYDEDHEDLHPKDDKQTHQIEKKKITTGSNRIHRNTKASTVEPRNSDTKQKAALQLAPALHSKKTENEMNPSSGRTSRKSRRSASRTSHELLLAPAVRSIDAGKGIRSPSRISTLTSKDVNNDRMSHSAEDSIDFDVLPGAMRVDGDVSITDSTLEYSMNRDDSEGFLEEEEIFARRARRTPEQGTGINKQRHDDGVNGDNSSSEVVEAFRVCDIGQAEIIRVEEHDQDDVEEVGIIRGDAEDEEVEERNKIKQKRILGFFCFLVVAAIFIVLGIVLAGMRTDTQTVDEAATNEPAINEPIQITSRTLQIIHSSEHESDLQDINTFEEKVLHFSAMVEGLRMLKSPASIHVATGDITLPGPFFTAAAEVESLDNHMGMGDIRILNAMKLDATALGNHEFDKGLAVFAKLLHESAFPFLSVNLDLNRAQVPEGVPKVAVGNDGSLCRDVAGRIVKSCVLETQIGRLGLIGRSPPNLYEIVENPGEALPGVTYYGGIDPDTGLPLVDSSLQIEEQVRLLESQGINIIILLDQSFKNFNEFGEPELAEELEGIDIVIAESWKNSIIFAQRESFGPFNFLRPEDAEGATYGAYPVVRIDSSGNRVLFVNSSGLYRYVGNLIITFDDDGFITSWDGRSGPLATSQEAIELMENVVGETLHPVPMVSETMLQLQNTPSIRDSFTVIGNTVFPLVGSRDQIRSRETNLGRLVAESDLWAGGLYAEEQGLPRVDAAFGNAGGIRASIPGPTIARISVRTTLAFNNKLILVKLSAGQIVAALENSVSYYPVHSGRFLQLAGIQIQFNATRPPVEGSAYTETPSRLRSVILAGDQQQQQEDDDGQTVLVHDYKLQPNARNRTFVIATNSFIGSGGDGYASIGEGEILSETGIGQQQILEDYLTFLVGSSTTNAMIDIPDPPPPPSRIVLLE